VAFMLEEEGLSRAAALRVAAEIAHSRPVLLRTMVEKELGLDVADASNALRSAAVMGLAFGVAALIPVLPYLFLPIASALYVSVIFTVAILFGMGVVKSRWTRRGWLSSAAEMVAVGAIAGVAGYLFGELLPALLGVAGFAA
jgi:vacuolar iron transporter family protein